jgi:hypothetical protein
LAAKCLFANFVDKTELINVEKVNTYTGNNKLQTAVPPLKKVVTDTNVVPEYSSTKKVQK